MQTRKLSILVVGPSWVGDMVMAQSLFLMLKEKHPNCNIDVVAPEWSLPILQRMPEVRQGVGLPVGHGKLGLMVRYRIAKQLRKINYDQAIVLPRSFKAALIPFFARIPKRTGFRGEWRYGLINDMRRFDIKELDKTVLDQTVKRFVSLGLSIDDQKDLKINHPQLQVKDHFAQQLMMRFSLNTAQPVVAVMPGAEYGPAKQWPLDYFAALVKGLYAQGAQVWVLGSAKDNTVAEKIILRAGGKGINLCGKTRLEEVVDLISLADVAVSNDSGLMHIAAAVNVPLIALYGSSSPSFTPPLSNKAEIVYRDLECSPCFKRECPLKHLNCLREIMPQDILLKTMEILNH